MKGVRLKLNILEWNKSHRDYFTFCQWHPKLKDFCSQANVHLLCVRESSTLALFNYSITYSITLLSLVSLY